METSRRIFVVGVILMVIALGTLAWASGQATRVPLTALKPHPNATGTAFIGGQSITIEAKGLKSNSVYTVWFVNMVPKKSVAGAGSAPHAFKTDSEGNGFYNAPLNKSPFGDWAMIMIMLHPTGDAKDMKNMVGALSAKL
ncbi:MAG: hypothetical protein JRJ03_12140 [Deltaproteobacteria bacterium]|nr:hypothetical protein [Deltaproteobacteria bacterium]